VRAGFEPFVQPTCPSLLLNLLRHPIILGKEDPTVRLKTGAKKFKE